MTAISIAQPDVTLLLDLEGVIRKATLSDTVPAESMERLARPSLARDRGRGRRRARCGAWSRTRAGSGVSGFQQVAQRFPSGLELPMEYTTVRLGEDGLIAIGKNLQAVADLQSPADRRPAGDGARLLEAARDRIPLPAPVRRLERGRGPGPRRRPAGRRGQPRGDPGLRPEPGRPRLPGRARTAATASRSRPCSRGRASRARRRPS